MTKDINPIDAFFNPKTIAIVGASERPNSIGNVMFINFLKPQVKAKVFPVNPRFEKILGVPAYSSVKEIKEDLDLVCIVTRATLVPKILDECIEKQAKAAIVISGGFKEIGGEGIEREEYIKHLTEKHPIRIMGPNCVGVFDTNSYVDTVFLPENRAGRPKKGSIALISQSGAVAGSLMDSMAYQNVGVSKIISFGNRVDVDETDMLQYLHQDENTSVITMYLEGLAPNRGPQLIKEGKKVSRDKPILILKGGKSEAGKRAASSHTGSLAGRDVIYDAAFKQAGILRMDNIQDLFDVSKALSMQPPAKGDRILILTDAGGAGVLTTDACQDLGMKVPALSKKIQEKLRSEFPPHCSVVNPVDVTGDTDNERYLTTLETVLPTNEVDAAIVVLMLQVPLMDEGVVDYIHQAMIKYKKPITAVALGGKYTVEVAKKAEEMGIPTTPTPERAAKAMWALIETDKIKQRMKKRSK
ncbi:MAG: acetate--CoA ligase family protein [Candidatus Ranarchaeia archaeon]|jgi:acetyl coenzyme A synthetase (ADP forming)-like protein